jgi:hypothetical protein
MRYFKLLFIFAMAMLYLSALRSIPTKSEIEKNVKSYVESRLRYSGED